ncbi:hypothetical protein CLOM_g16509, partial [Closterium sp. NIES-68]
LAQSFIASSDISLILVIQLSLDLASAAATASFAVLLGWSGGTVAVLLQGRVSGVGSAVQGEPLSSLLLCLFVHFLIHLKLPRPSLYSLPSPSFFLTNPLLPSLVAGHLAAVSKTAAEHVAEQQWCSSSGHSISSSGGSRDRTAGQQHRRGQLEGRLGR